MADYAQALTFSVGAIIAIIVISNPISTSAIFIIVCSGRLYRYCHLSWRNLRDAGQVRSH